MDCSRLLGKRYGGENRLSDFVCFCEFELYQCSVLVFDDRFPDIFPFEISKNLLTCFVPVTRNAKTRHCLFIQEIPNLNKWFSSFCSLLSVSKGYHYFLILGSILFWQCLHGILKFSRLLSPLQNLDLSKDIQNRLGFSSK